MKKLVLTALVAAGVTSGAPAADACHTLEPVNPRCWVHVEYLDPATCDLLKLLPGGYGPVVINSHGDVYVDGKLFWDCPPYVSAP